MPLSEHEQRLLDQIERALYAEDPKFATSVRSTDLRTHMRRRLRRAAVVEAVGLLLLLAGVATGYVVGILGFVVMVGGLMMALSAWHRLGSTSKATAGGGNVLRSTTGRTERSTKRPRSTGSVKQRLEERWKRRWEERGGPQ